jgi:ABC-type phosphate/phosphonate transport system substrate-binding protein
MRRSATWAAALALAVLLGTGAGCRSFFNLSLGALDDPLRMGLVTDNPAELLNPFSRYDPLLGALSKQVGRKIHLEPCFAFQAGPQLHSGRLDLAVATPAQFAQFADHAQLPVLAIPTRAGIKAIRPAVLVVRRADPLPTVADLRGQRVAFGPEDDSRLYHAALECLRTHGVAPEDLAAGLPLFQTLWKHEPNAATRINLVLRGEVQAAFVDEADWDALPERAAAEDQPCRSKLAVIAQTPAYPDWLVVVSPQLEAAEREAVQTFLLAVGDEHPDVLRALGIVGYVRPTPELIETCGAMPVTDPADDEDAPTP